MQNHEPYQTDDEELTALLDFEPVPRRPRVDGWTPEVQRAFVAALAVTGSKRRAAAAVGKAQYGVEQLLRAKGNEGFVAACARALAIYRDKGERRIRIGVDMARAEDRAWRPARGPWSQAATRAHVHAPPAPAAPEPEEEGSEEATLEWLADIAKKYLIKVDQERQARIEGRIVEADFYLRQMTWLEVALDLASGDGFKFLADFRAGDYGLVDLVETPMSRLLGELRRQRWVERGDLPRPDHPPSDRLVDHGPFSTEPSEYTQGGVALSHEEQKRIFEERHRQAAADQLDWEEEARRDYDRRRDSAAGS